MGHEDNHKKASCSDGAMVLLKATKQNEDPSSRVDQPKKIVPPQWPQPSGLFQDVKSEITFNPNVFFSTLNDVHNIIEVQRSTNLTMEQTAFADLLERRSITTDDGSVLFKLFDVDSVPEPPQELVVCQANNKFIKLNVLEVPNPAANSQVANPA